MFFSANTFIVFRKGFKGLAHRRHMDREALKREHGSIGFDVLGVSVIRFVLRGMQRLCRAYRRKKTGHISTINVSSKGERIAGMRWSNPVRKI
jgi:cytochrome b561